MRLRHTKFVKMYALKDEIRSNKSRVGCEGGSNLSLVERVIERLLL